MRILSKKALNNFYELHSEAKQALLAWYREVKQADWERPDQVLERFPKASIVGSDKVVFRISGGSYRIVARVFYPGRIVYIRFVGTHDEYERIDVEEV